MITYPISINFCKKRFSGVLSKGEYPNGVQVFTFLQEHSFVSCQIFQKKFDRW